MSLGRLHRHASSQGRRPAQRQERIDRHPSPGLPFLPQFDAVSIDGRIEREPISRPCLCQEMACCRARGKHQRCRGSGAVEARATKAARQAVIFVLRYGRTPRHRRPARPFCLVVQDRPSIPDNGIRVQGVPSPASTAGSREICHIYQAKPAFLPIILRHPATLIRNKEEVSAS